MKQIDLPLYKFYLIEGMTQEDLNELALERNNLQGQVVALETEKLHLENEIEKLNNIIKRFEEDLREVYLTFGEFSEEYTEKKIRELKGEDKE